MTYTDRRELLEKVCQEIETADAYERTARYHQASAARSRAVWHLERIGIRNLIVDPRVT